MRILDQPAVKRALKQIDDRRRRLLRPLSPQLVVCTRCRNPIENAHNRLRHIGHAFCEPCARYVGLVDGIERDPRKYGGHEYRGPK